MSQEEKNKIIVFESSDGLAKIEVNTDYDTVWLSLMGMVELFQRDKSVISRHVRNIFKEEELEEKATVANFATVQTEGDREIVREIKHYNLDMIISVGYRVKSKRGIEFRKWATNILKQYLIDGYALNPTRIQQVPGSLVDLFKMQVQLWERQELMNSEIQKDIQELGEKIMKIEAKVTSVDDHYYTIAGFCSLQKIPCPIHKAKEWGKLATRMSRDMNMPTGVAHDERFGRVRTYHVDVLKQTVKYF